MQRPTLAVIFAAVLASAATFVLALLPAWLSVPATAQDGLRVVQLPRVVISAPRADKVVELPRVLVLARRAAAGNVVAASGGQHGAAPAVMAPQRR